MKCETTNTVLTFVLGALALLGVIFALQTIFRTREYQHADRASQRRQQRLHAGPVPGQ